MFRTIALLALPLMCLGFGCPSGPRSGQSVREYLASRGWSDPAAGWYVDTGYRDDEGDDGGWFWDDGWDFDGGWGGQGSGYADDRWDDGGSYDGGWDGGYNGGSTGGHGGSGNASIDPCDQNGWYNDGVCDPFCDAADPDCEEDEGDHCEAFGWYDDGVCDTCPFWDPDCG